MKDVGKYPGVLVIGDSLTEYSLSKSPDGWVVKLMRMYGRSNDIVVRARAKYNTTALLLNIIEYTRVLEDRESIVVFLWIGSNDFANKDAELSTDEYEGNLRKLVNFMVNGIFQVQAQNKQLKIVLISIMYWKVHLFRMFLFMDPEKNEQFYAIQKRVADEFKEHCVFVDMYEPFQAILDNNPPDVTRNYYADDLIHLSQKGEELVWEHVQVAAARVLSTERKLPSLENVIG
jgi:lysophospholipase L1-like esterase